MGATFDITKFPMMSPKELYKEFGIKQQELCEQFGNDTYAGHLGIKDGLDIENRKFESFAEAERWIADNNEKWNSAVAVQAIIYGSQEFPVTAADKDLLKRYNDLNNYITEGFAKEIIERNRKAKSKLRTCGKCYSKITTKYIRSLECPVCRNNYLVTETDNKRTKAWCDKREKLMKQIKDRKAKIAASDSGKQHKKYIWVVGGWCAS